MTAAWKGVRGKSSEVKKRKKLKKKERLGRECCACVCILYASLHLWRRRRERSEGERGRRRRHETEDQILTVKSCRGTMLKGIVTLFLGGKSRAGKAERRAPPHVNLLLKLSPTNCDSTTLPVASSLC